MEQKLMYLILSGWALMFMLSSIYVSVAAALVFGVMAVYIAQFDQRADAELLHLFIRLGPIVAVVVFVAWPIGALMRWMLRSKRRREN